MHASSPAAPPVDNPSEFDRLPQRGKLWSPDDTPSKASGARPSRTQRSQPAFTSNSHDEDSTSKLIKQPETRPISQDQLVAEVKGIYAGLVMVESKCIEVCSSQNAQHDINANKLNNEQWQALIALHRTLLHEHHDFFLASQHPSASPPLRRLASKYAMPARMWRHGIHSFLELLRHRLPASLEHMLTFIYLAYSMMALLYETVPTFEDTWIECLGDLGRYRMAIEDDDIKDREVWTVVSRGWYSKASDKAPTTGRLYHHLAILARPNALQQLYYYTKSLCVAVPFVSARESVMTLFDPIMALASNHQSRLPPLELAFVRCHGCMFSAKFPEKLEPSMDEFVSSLDSHIARSGRKFLEAGYDIAISNANAAMGYGHEDNPIYREIRELDQPATFQPDYHMEGSEIREKPTPTPLSPADLKVQQDLTTNAVRLANRTHNVVFRRFGDTNILPYTHVTLAFVYHMTLYPDSMSRDLAPDFPWKLCAAHLNTLLNTIEGDAFPEAVGDIYESPEPEHGGYSNRPRRPLPEDFAMRGLLWTDKYLPDEYFYERIDDEEKYFEVASMAEQRRERVLYLGCKIAKVGGGRYLRYSNRSFGAGPEYDIELEGLPEPAAESKDLGVLPDATATVSP
ncbi:hypothetical protein GQ53DRAFT_670500 [Thozetella sp. PMI_491]|nr:hypothetical protein GQ53DRAFT_670500 [Thozetella sp. PMI_491]